MREVSVSGSAYEMGVQHGRQLKDLVRDACRRYRKPGVGPENARASLAARLSRNLEAAMPWAVQQMRGIADGAELSYGEVFELNHCFELWGKTWIDDEGAVATACTVIGAPGAPEGPVVSKNCDVALGDGQYLVVEHAAPDEGYRYVHALVAGTVWTEAGVNEAGLAYSDAYAGSRTVNYDGVSVAILDRHLIQHCATVREAVDTAGRFDVINYGDHILLADACGHVALLEKTPNHQAVRLPEDEFLFAANGLTIPELRPYEKPDTVLLANSLDRYDHLRALTKHMAPSMENLVSLLRDHGQPGAICQHGQAQLYTEGSFVVIARDRTLLAAAGRACEQEYVRYSLAQKAPAARSVG